MPLTDRQRYLFDLRGYVTIENVLSPVEVETLRNCITTHYTPPDKLTQETCYRFDILNWGRPMLDLMLHPLAMEWTKELCGNRPRLDHVYHYFMRRGQPEALTLHGGGHRVNHSEYFFFKNGKMHNGLVVAAWALVDSLPGQGGFCCVPGSHKSNYNYQSLYDPSSYADPVVHVPLKAGSLVLFTEALTHGTMPWTADHERHTLFYKYCPTAGSWETYKPEQAAAVKKQFPKDWPAEKIALANTLLDPPHVHY
jgi:hypothetical protein